MVMVSRAGAREISKSRRTVDAEFDEFRVDVTRTPDGEAAVLELGPVGALVEHPVLEQPKVLQAVPLGAGLCVLGGLMRESP